MYETITLKDEKYAGFKVNVEKVRNQQLYNVLIYDGRIGKNYAKSVQAKSKVEAMQAIKPLLDNLKVGDWFVIKKRLEAKYEITGLTRESQPLSSIDLDEYQGRRSPPLSHKIEDKYVQDKVAKQNSYSFMYFYKGKNWKVTINHADGISLTFAEQDDFLNYDKLTYEDRERLFTEDQRKEFARSQGSSTFFFKAPLEAQIQESLSRIRAFDKHWIEKKTLAIDLDNYKSEDKIIEGSEVYKGYTIAYKILQDFREDRNKIILEIKKGDEIFDQLSESNSLYYEPYYADDEGKKVGNTTKYAEELKRETIDKAKKLIDMYSPPKSLKTGSEEFKYRMFDVSMHWKEIEGGKFEIIAEASYHDSNNVVATEFDTKDWRDDNLEKSKQEVRDKIKSKLASLVFDMSTEPKLKRKPDVVGEVMEPLKKEKYYGYEVDEKAEERYKTTAKNKYWKASSKKAGEKFEEQERERKEKEERILARAREEEEQRKIVEAREKEIARSLDITKSEFKAYERVRQSGVTNMFAVNVVQEYSGLSRQKIMDIMKNYDVLVKKYGRED